MRIRITFAKQGPLRYTGHLDLHKLWERAARRAELPLAYSQGFHPQPKMNIAAALPLGFSSRCEVMDMKLEHEIQLERLRTSRGRSECSCSKRTPISLPSLTSSSRCRLIPFTDKCKKGFFREFREIHPEEDQITLPDS